MPKGTSTASSPPVCYSLSCSTTKTPSSSGTVSIELNCIAWLPSEKYQLNRGTTLTLFARTNFGGKKSAWKSCEIKSRTDLWSGAGRHASTILLSSETKNSETGIELYISRTGSYTGDSAGSWASKVSPHYFKVTLPPYSAMPSVKKSAFYFNMNDRWVEAVPYVKLNGHWEKATPYIKIGNNWVAV